MTRYVVAEISEIPPGSRKLVSAHGRQIAVFNLAGEFFGLTNKCPHQGGPMCEGPLTGLVEADRPGELRYSRPGEVVRCPWHNWEFDIRTGHSVGRPGRVRLRRFPTEIAEGEVVMDGPYVAETVPVRVEARYVVVEL